MTDIDKDRQRVTLKLQDGREVALGQAQIARADVRLSYVHHPFPAQGLTTDTTHMLVAEHTTAQGSYVALTRARERTRIYASREQLDNDTTRADRDPLHELAEHMSRTEPEMPSIHTPLAHEHTITTELDQTVTRGIGNNPGAGAHNDHRRERPPSEHVTAVLGPQPSPNDPNRETWEHAASEIERYRTSYAIDDPSALGPEPPAGEFGQRKDRRRAAAQVLDALEKLDRLVDQNGPLDQRILNTSGLTNDHSKHDRTIGWEP